MVEHVPACFRNSFFNKELQPGNCILLKTVVSPIFFYFDLRIYLSLIKNFYLFSEKRKQRTSSWDQVTVQRILISPIFLSLPEIMLNKFVDTEFVACWFDPMYLSRPPHKNNQYESRVFLTEFLFIYFLSFFLLSRQKFQLRSNYTIKYK